MTIISELEKPQVVPHISEKYEVGAIVENSYGYEQTNIEYFLIVKRSDSAKGATTLTLAPLGKHIIWERDMVGECCPARPGVADTERAIRRRLAKEKASNKECGLCLRGYGWARVWDGLPSFFSTYG